MRRFRKRSRLVLLIPLAAVGYASTVLLLDLELIEGLRKEEP
jgi:hypothetical protein